MNVAPGRGLTMLAGARAFIGGIAFIISTPSLWAHALVPLAILLVLTIGLAVLGVWAVIHEIEFHSGVIGHWLLYFLASLAAVLLAGLVAFCLAQPFSAFALNTIALAQEQELTGRRPHSPSLLGALLHSVLVMSIALLLGGLALALLFALGLVCTPLLPLIVVLKLLVIGWLVAWNFLDYPFGLHGTGLKARLHWAWRHFGAFTSFGLLWATVMVVPGIILLFLPMGVAGATRLVVATEAD
jgi:uncharacterized protein involved in cysteine biosynthesis